MNAHGVVLEFTTPYLTDVGNAVNVGRRTKERPQRNTPMPEVQILPPVPESASSPHFDRHAHVRRAKAVTAKTGIAFSDFGKMSVKGKDDNKDQFLQPPWASDPKKIQRIVCGMMHAMLTSRATANFPQDEFDADSLALALKLEERLNKRCIDVRGAKDQIQLDAMLGQRKNKTFGYAKILTKVIYDSFCLLRPSNQIAADLAPIVTPCGVRQHRSRANMLARVIFDEKDNLPYSKKTGPLYKAAIEYKRQRFLAGVGNKVCEGRSKCGSLPKSTEVFMLTQAGHTMQDLATEYGCSISIIRDRYRVGRRKALGGQRPKPSFPLINVLKMWKQGYGLDQIAQASELSVAFLHCILQNRWGQDLTAPRNEGTDAVLDRCIRDEDAWHKAKGKYQAERAKVTRGIIERNMEEIERPGSFEDFLERRSGIRLGSQVAG
jgi:hypothetical protein